jgi:hypothetical protein
MELCRLTEVWAKFNRINLEIAINKMEQTQHKENKKHQRWRKKNKPEESE